MTLLSGQGAGGGSSASHHQAPSFQESEVTAGALVLLGLPKGAPGSEEEKEFGVWAAGLVDKAGPLGPRAACIAQMCGACQAWRPWGLFPGWEGGAPVLSPRMEIP